MALCPFLECGGELVPGLKVHLGVQVSAFYASSNPPKYLARLCFCKDDSKLEAASQALRQYFLK